MNISRSSISAKRESTDASLVTERAGSGAVADAGAIRTRRLADDLVERERILVDEQLWRFRDSADIVLARARLVSQAPLSAVGQERALADRAKVGERELHDAVLEQERHRSDDAIQDRRDEPTTDPAERARRADTDEKLGAERRSVDTAVTTLGSTAKALSVAEEEVERRSHVLAMVAHELRSPLSVIAMNADFIAARIVDSAALESLTDVQHSVYRMERLLQDLLDLARIEGGTFRIVREPLDVSSLVHEVRAAYGPLFAKRGVTFTAVPGAAGAYAIFDHDRVVQVLSNLLCNAMKFTPVGGTVALRMERRAGEVELTVSDTGPGIDAGALPHVFNRFWQGNSEPGTGLGLGLHICKEIITAHEGRIWVESGPAKGTTFHFTLPAQRSAPDRLPRLTSSPRGARHALDEARDRGGGLVRTLLQEEMRSVQLDLFEVGP
jgi:signal transduction histidine kinase